MTIKPLYSEPGSRMASEENKIRMNNQAVWHGGAASALFCSHRKHQLGEDTHNNQPCGCKHSCHGANPRGKEKIQK